MMLVFLFSIQLLRVMKEYEVPLTFHQYRPMLRVSDEENQTV